MNSTTNRSNFVDQVLAVAGISAFWLLPLSPFIAILAVSRTQGTCGWPRRLSVLAAIVCTVYTLSAAGWIALLFMSLERG